MENPSHSTYHVLLIGIDSYPVKPLLGCVNDIDAIQRLLLDKRVGLSAASIKRLASPHPGVKHESTIPAAPATLANMRAALAELGSARVSPGDRVFIYYSGHGSYTRVVTADGRTFQRESLVPVDFDKGPQRWQVLLDFELNRLLSAIAARTRSLSFVLDCCNSAGATREVVDRRDAIPRFIDPRQDLGRADSLPIGEVDLPIESQRGLAGSVDDCHVVAACLNHEQAQESAGKDGTRNGLLTRAFVAALGDVPDSDLRSVPWGRIWQRMRADVETENPSQHLWMAGNSARAVLAGPPVDGDLGLTVARSGTNAYRIGAGTLAGVTSGARVALYGERPALFPPLGSEADTRARLPTAPLKVTSAERATSLAAAEGTPFDVPPGARGRLVQPGAPERLRCAVLPQDGDLAASLADSQLLEIVNEASAQVRLERHLDGSCALTDDVHGAKAGYPVLIVLRPDELHRARAVLEHYFSYALPLRMARQCSDLSGALRVTVLACPKDRDLTAAEAQEAKLPEAPRQAEFSYELIEDDRICISVQNTSSVRLRVTLLNSSASGKVQLLGDQAIGAMSFGHFWANSALGRPFQMSLPAGVAQGIDRFVAIGTTAFEKDISYLRLDTTFADVLERGTRGARRDVRDAEPISPPADQWTATETIVRTSQA